MCPTTSKQTQQVFLKKAASLIVGASFPILFNVCANDEPLFKFVLRRIDIINRTPSEVQALLLLNISTVSTCRNNYRSWAITSSFG
jgi:hypothetical protein